MTTTMTIIQVSSADFSQEAADRLEAAAARPGALIEVVISGVRFSAHCPVGLFALIDELATGRDWRATVS